MDTVATMGELVMAEIDIEGHKLGCQAEVMAGQTQGMEE